MGKARNQLAPFNPIISGDFDADRIDYLIRDNRQSGFQISLELDELHGAVYLRRIEVPAGPGVRTRGTPRYELVIGAGALPFVNSVLAARHRLIRRVHLARYGRAATQMMAACLFEVFRSHKPAELRKRIRKMHEEWTDFTFFEQLKGEIEDRLGQPSGIAPLSRVFLTTSGEINRRPVPERTWSEVCHIPFMQMHPCLRLLVHAAATCDWVRPENHTFADNEGRIIVVEPSAKASRASDLMAEFGSLPGERRDPDSLDFFGATENRLGRAIVVEAMSNIDVFAYCAASKGAPASLRPLRDDGGPPWREVYWTILAGIDQDVARAATGIAARAREKWPVRQKGMIAAEYVLALLHCLEAHVHDHCTGARGIYVYGSGLFVNRFVPEFGLEDGEAGGLFPALFRADPASDDDENGDTRGKGKDIFSQIQRLAAFGLVLVRANSVINTRRDSHSRATRTRVYSTREEIRINTWGRFYVEREIAPRQLACLREAIDRRQTPIVPSLKKMSVHYTDLDAPSLKRYRTSKPLADLEARRGALARKIHNEGGCAMTFSLPSSDRPGDGAGGPGRD